jgi:ribose transport system ATP-binding protein
VLSRLGLSRLDPDTPVDRLGVGVRQMVEIASGLSQRCRVFILDEPTSALTDTETEALFEQIRRLTAEGVGILYISHRLEEIGRIAHRVTVMRDGRIVGTDRSEALSREEIVTRMVGRDIRQAAPKFNRPTTTPGLTVRGLTCPPVHNVSFTVNRGEIFGIAGLMGSGRTELVRAIFGADRPRRGEVCVGGASTPARIRSPRDAVRCGIALLTEDRKAQGLLGPLPVRWNASLASLSRVSHAGWVSTRKEREDVLRLTGALSIKCAMIEQPVTHLSGGNQQKVVLAKWLMRDCEVFVFDEPTRGIDVGAKFEIYNLLSELANRGKAIVVVSSELPELLGVCDRIGVMSAGRMTAVFSRHDFSQQRIMEAALSGYGS